MNDHIKELARQAGLAVDKTGTFPEFAEKTRLDCFAELIVKDVLNDVRWYSLDADDIDDSIKYIRHKVSKRYGIDLFDDAIKR